MYIFRHPFNTGCLPLSYSGNPGVRWRISQGFGLKVLRGWRVASNITSYMDLRGGVHTLADRRPSLEDMAFTHMGCHDDSGVNSQY